MIILGIDPGTATTGYGVIEKNDRDGSLKIIDYGCILSKSSEQFGDRLEKIFNELTDLIKEKNPQEVAIEELFFAANTKTAISVGHARGVIMLACRKAKKPIFEYTPLQVKQAICGYGRGDKQQIQRMVKTLLKLDHIPKPDDAADGLAIAMCHAANLNSISKIKSQITKT